MGRKGRRPTVKGPDTMRPAAASTGYAGSTIYLQSGTVVSNNAIEGGKGANVSDSAVRQGGQGGSGFGGGVAVNAPASGPVNSETFPAATLNIAGGTSFLNNMINQTLTSGNKISIRGGTGGSCNSGPGGTGGNVRGPDFTWVPVN